MLIAVQDFFWSRIDVLKIKYLLECQALKRWRKDREKALEGVLRANYG